MYDFSQTSRTRVERTAIRKQAINSSLAKYVTAFSREGVKEDAYQSLRITTDGWKVSELEEKSNARFLPDAYAILVRTHNWQAFAGKVLMLKIMTVQQKNSQNRAFLHLLQLCDKSAKFVKLQQTS